MVRYSNQERAEMALYYSIPGVSSREAATRFHQQHPNRPIPDIHTIINNYNKLLQFGSCADRNKSGRKRIASEDDEIAILAYFVAHPQTSIRDASGVLNFRKETIRRILKRYHYHPYKQRLVHGLNDADFEKRITFCLWAQAMLILDPDFAANIIFTDEAMFYLNGKVSKHHWRHWSDYNPYWARVSHVQVNPRVLVWAGVWGNRIIGPFFIHQPLTGATYLELLEDEIWPLISDEIEQQIEDGSQVYWMQDGAPPHFALAVRNWLNEKFGPNWMGRGGPIPWPARSPDLTIMDSFVWGFVKRLVYGTPVPNLAELILRIQYIFDDLIAPIFLENSREDWALRLQQCLDAQGGNFEHIRK